MTMVAPLTKPVRVTGSIALGLLLAAVLAVEVHNLMLTGRPWQLDLAVGLACCGAALLRDRRRALAAGVALVISGGAELAAWVGQLPGEPGFAATLALLVLTGSAALALPLRQVIAICAVAAAIATGMVLTHPDLGFLPFLLLTLATGIGLGFRLKLARRAATVDRVRRSERLELARELHDTAAHHITAIVISAQAARITARRQPDALDAALAAIESVSTEALASMRRVIGLLREPGQAGSLVPAGYGAVIAGPQLLGSLAELADRFASQGLPVRLHQPAGHQELAWPPEVTTTVHRVVQEALANVTKHAATARAVTVTVGPAPGTVTVEITDDADPGGQARLPHAAGYGLIGMRERVEALGGTLQAGPRPGRGWSVLATLPVPVER
jgi:signal transduction histidine kinase